LSEQAILNELRAIKRSLQPENSYMERFNLTKAAVVSSFDGTLRLDGQAFNLYVISTDGEIDDISYQIINVGGGKVDEMEAAQFPYIPGPVAEIQFKNDIAEAGKSIQITAYKISRLAPPMPPPSPPGTRGEIVDPFFGLGGPSTNKMLKPFNIAKETGVGSILNMGAAFTTTAEHDALQSPSGTDVQVSTGKKLIIFAGMCKTSAAAKALGLGYADDAVDNSATPGTNEVVLINPNAWENATPDETFELIDCYVEIPAAKFPHALAESTSGTLAAHFLGGRGRCLRKSHARKALGYWGRLLQVLQLLLGLAPLERLWGK